MTFFLHLDGPVITRTQGYSISEAAAPGSTVTLLCAIDANPVELRSMKWLKDDKEISLMNVGTQWERRIEGNEASLIGKSIRKEDAGQYACEIENSFGNSRATIPLVVQCELFRFFQDDHSQFNLDAPEIDRTDPSRNKAAADSDRLMTAELHCYLSAIPRPTIIWTKVG